MDEVVTGSHTVLHPGQGWGSAAHPPTPTIGPGGGACTWSPSSQPHLLFY